MKNKGFTLVELLAVIVILAIIALIATPVVLNMIKNARVNSAKVGANNYAKAFEETLVQEIVKGKELSAGAYSIIGNTYTMDEAHGLVEAKGTLPSSGSICINKKGQVTSYVLKINEYIIGFFDKKQELLTEEEAQLTCDGIVVVKNDKTKPNCTIKAEVIDNEEKVIENYQEGTYENHKIKITVTGKDSDSKISKIEIIASKEKDTIVYKDINEEEKVVTYKNEKEGINEITAKVTDYAGNIATCNTIKVGQDFTTSISANVKPLTLGSSDYDFKNNVTATYLGGEGTVECTPESSKKTGTYDVTCTAKPINGREVSTVFTVKHSYAATRVPKTCNKTCSCTSTWTLTRGPYENASGTPEYEYSCSCNGVSKSGYFCDGGAAKGAYCSISYGCGTYDCSYYTCPNGGTLSGTMCNY